MDTTPISMINCTDPDFTPISDSQKFPNVILKDDGYGLNESNCHMLSLCMKVGPLMRCHSCYSYPVETGHVVHACYLILPKNWLLTATSLRVLKGPQAAYESTIVIKDIVENDW